MDQTISGRVVRSGTESKVVETALQLAQAAGQADLVGGVAISLDGLLAPVPLSLDAAAVANARLPFDGAQLEQSWHDSIAELIEASGTPGAIDHLIEPPPGASATAGSSVRPEASLATVGADLVEPEPESHPAFSPRSYVIEAIDQPRDSLLALQESDLFAGDSPARLVSLASEDRGPQPLDDMAFELFGSVDDLLTDGLAAGVGRGGAASDPDDTDPEKSDPQREPGYIGLLGDDFELPLSPEDAAAAVDDKGDLLIQGDGDDTVILTGEWIDAAPDGSTAQIFKTVDGDYTVEIRDATVEYQVYV